jgi:hypothetical protein
MASHTIRNIDSKPVCTMVTSKQGDGTGSVFGNTNNWWFAPFIGDK